MVKCNIVRIEDGKDQFTVLLENMTQDDINQLCHSIADRVTYLYSLKQTIRAVEVDRIFDAVNNERLKECL